MKTKEIKPFDTLKQPEKPRPILFPVELGGSAAFLAPVGGKITKVNCENLEPPYLILANHASFVDFPLVVKAIFPKRTNWVISIEEFNGREWLMRGIGGIYKRKFTSDIRVVRHMLTVLRKRKGIVTMYPEARFSLAGINERLDDALGKFVKTARCPVVIFLAHGNFLRSPQWNKHPVRSVKIDATMTQIVTAEEAATLPAAEIQKRIEEALVYDDYAWQAENNIRIKSKKRAHNIHRILYQCPVCGEEFTTDSDGTRIWCNSCFAEWEMDELGKLHRKDGGEDVFTHVPDWYRWERENVYKEVREGRYHFEDTVRLEELVNCQKAGFVTLGNVTLTHDRNGFTMHGKLDDGTDFDFHRTVRSMYSCHIEYNFKERGDAIDLATLDKTYFVFPQTAHNVLTKIHFATEALYDVVTAEEKAAKEAEKQAETPAAPIDNQG